MDYSFFTYNETFYTHFDGFYDYAEIRQQILKRKLDCQLTNNPGSSDFACAFNTPSGCNIPSIPKPNNLNSTNTTSEDVSCEMVAKLTICDGYGQKDLQENMYSSAKRFKTDDNIIGANQQYKEISHMEISN